MQTSAPTRQNAKKAALGGLVAGGRPVSGKEGDETLPARFTNRVVLSPRCGDDPIERASQQGVDAGLVIGLDRLQPLIELGNRHFTAHRFAPQLGVALRGDAVPDDLLGRVNGLVQRHQQSQDEPRNARHGRTCSEPPAECGATGNAHCDSDDKPKTAEQPGVEFVTDGVRLGVEARLVVGAGCFHGDSPIWQAPVAAEAACAPVAAPVFSRRPDSHPVPWWFLVQVVDGFVLEDAPILARSRRPYSIGNFRARAKEAAMPDLAPAYRRSAYPALGISRPQLV